jgi:RecA-family ATPase
MRNAILPAGARAIENNADGEILEVPIADLFTNPTESPEFLIEEMLPAGALTLLGAHGGAGKSILALQAAVCLACGLPFFGKAARRCRVIFYSAEDPGPVIRHRLTRICRYMRVEPAMLSEWLKIFDATSKPVLFAESKVNGVKNGIALPSYRMLSQEAEKFGAEAVIVDNASDTFDANEIERARVREFIRILPRLRQGRSVAVLLLAHVDKQTARGATSSEGYSGSTAWHNSARSRWSLVSHGDLLMLEHHKSNLGKLADPIPLVLEQ